MISNTNSILLYYIITYFLSVSDLSRYLTYDQIYNNTDYVQIRQSMPHSVPPTPNFSNHRYNRNNHIVETKGKDLDHHNLRDENLPSSQQLLVGFSHDPYRYSIPEADYLKGMR